MRIFVNEPLLDWQHYAKQEAKERDDVPADSISWYPEQKIKLACRKLSLGNPVYITTEELKAGHSKKPEALAAMISIVKGDPNTHLRWD